MAKTVEKRSLETCGCTSSYYQECKEFKQPMTEGFQIVAVPRSFALTPHDGMLVELRRDYEVMSGMVFGPLPALDEVAFQIAELERSINRVN